MSNAVCLFWGRSGNEQVFPDLLQVKQEAHQLVGPAKRRATKIRPKAVEGGICCRFSNFDIFRLKVADYVTSDVAID